jgi:hypothetical protein
MASSDLRSTLGHFAGSLLIGVAFTGTTRWQLVTVNTGVETDLSCSVMDCAIVPLPRRRRVLGRCTSKIFTPSMAFAHPNEARLPLSPALQAGFTTPLDSSGPNALRTDCLLDPQRAFVVALRQSGLPFRRPPATELLGHYSDWTFTSKPITAWQDTLSTVIRKSGLAAMKTPEPRPPEIRNHGHQTSGAVSTRGTTPFPLKASARR